MNEEEDQSSQSPADAVSSEETQMMTPVSIVAIWMWIHRIQQLILKLLKLFDLLNGFATAGCMYTPR